MHSFLYHASYIYWQPILIRFYTTLETLLIKNKKLKLFLTQITVKYNFLSEHIFIAKR